MQSKQKLATYPQSEEADIIIAQVQMNSQIEGIHVIIDSFMDKTEGMMSMDASMMFRFRWLPHHFNGSTVRFLYVRI